MKIRMKRGVTIDVQHEETLRAITAVPSNSNAKNAPFPTFYQALPFAAALGWKIKREISSGSRKNMDQVKAAFFDNDSTLNGRNIALMISLLKHKDYDSILDSITDKDDYVEDFISFANAGLEKIQSWIDKSPDRENIADAIINGLREIDALPKTLKQKNAESDTISDDDFFES